MPSSASRPAANSETPSNTTDSFAIFNGVVLQQSKRQMMSLMRSRTAATAPRITLCTTLRRWHSSEATRESHQHFTLASPHAADPRGPHLEQGLVADAFARREFSSLLHVRIGQSQCDLNTCSPVQLPDQTRSLRHFLLRLRRFLLQKLASLHTSRPR